MVKAYKVYFDGACAVTEDSENVYYECFNFDTDTPVFTMDEINNLKIGDEIQRDEWTIKYVEVENGYIESLSEFDGWD